MTEQTIAQIARLCDERAATYGTLRQSSLTAIALDRAAKVLRSISEAPRAYLMTGPWELDPTGANPGIYVDDPAGGDPICLATIKRLHRPTELRAHLLSEGHDHDSE